jgi:hypothetical protein
MKHFIAAFFILIAMNFNAHASCFLFLCSHHHHRATHHHETRIIHVVRVVKITKTKIVTHIEKSQNTPPPIQPVK